MIRPKFVENGFISGAANCERLNVLMVSSRSWSAIRSLILNSRIKLAFHWLVMSCRTPSTRVGKIRRWNEFGPRAATRYLAHDFGPQGLRVNAISAGPIRTLAASGVGGFKTLYNQFAALAPLRQNVTIEDVGNAAVFLCSDLAARITGEVLYVDSGYHIMGIPEPTE